MNDLDLAELASADTRQPCATRYTPPRRSPAPGVEALQIRATTGLGKTRVVIDELAAEAGVGAHVADITARAMNGELDFEAALLERVGLLKGLPLSVIVMIRTQRHDPDWLAAGHRQPSYRGAPRRPPRGCRDTASRQHARKFRR